jgi:hypothetical protein
LKETRIWYGRYFDCTCLNRGTAGSK